MESQVCYTCNALTYFEAIGGSDRIFFDPATKTYYRYQDDVGWDPLDKLALQAGIMRHGIPAEDTSKVANEIAVGRYGAPKIAGSHLIPLGNGVMDLSADQPRLRRYGIEDFFYHRIPHAYRANSRAPRFEQFLAEITQPFGEDAPAVGLVLKEFLGYSLCTNTEQEKFLFLSGPGANGKSVFAKLSSMLLGERNVVAFANGSFGNSYSRAQLQGKLLVQVNEVAASATLPVDTIKALVSGDCIHGRAIYRAPVSFRPYAKLLVVSNFTGRVDGDPKALARRILYIHLPRVFGDAEQDRSLEATLENEAEGILRLVIDAYRGVLDRGGFTTCRALEEARQHFVREVDPTRAFFHEGCAFGSAAQISSSTLYALYKKYVREQYGQRPVSHKAFVQLLKAETPVVTRHTRHGTLLIGVCGASAERTQASGDVQGVHHDMGSSTEEAEANLRSH